MGDARHTPGPWSVRPDRNDDWGIVRAADGRPVADAGVSPRADEFRDREDVPSHEWEAGPPEVAANARLIAASPTLLAVLLAYERWEADMLLCQKAWAGGMAEFPTLTAALWDRLLEIQTMRNAAKREALGDG